MANNHVTKLSIDLGALNFNLNYFKSKIDNSTKMLVVIKSFGYGSNALEIAKHLTNKVDYFAVAYVDEGIALRKNGIKTPILVLHPQRCNLKKLIAYQLEPNIYSHNLLEAVIQDLTDLDLQNYPIHLKFNTGLNRLGFIKDDIDALVQKINSTNIVEVLSVFSHIAASEDLNEKEFTLKQIGSFENIASKISNGLKSTPMKHILNTSGIINYANEAQFDMVRLGIGLYGFGNERKQTEKLQSALQLTSIISQIHTINEGESIGYNRSHIASKPMRTATVPIGHADGISRQLGNGKGYVFIGNQKVPIVGNVCMDMIMIDVTNLKSCSEGDEVLIYKDQAHIEDLAGLINTIPYEILTAISQRVQRTLLDE